MIIGVDPGITGAIAVRYPDGDWSVHNMPVSVKTAGKGNQVSCQGLVALLDELEPFDIRCAFVERVNAMPPKLQGGQQRLSGATSMFGFGRSAGVIEMLFAARSIPYDFVPPAHWKKYYGLTGKGKDAARTKALELFPSAGCYLTHKTDVGRADALLIAHYGYDRLNGGIFS